MVAKQLGKLLPVLAVLMNAQFQILGEVLIEFLVLVLVLCNFAKEL